MKSLFINVVMKRFCLFLSFFVLLSSCDKQAEPQAPGQEQDNPGDPGGEVVPPPADVPDMFSVKTLFGNVGFNNAADKKKGGDASTAILGSVRGLGMISAGKAFVLEQAQTIRLWDMEQKTLSEPITYGDGNHVPWLGTVNAVLTGDRLDVFAGCGRTKSVGGVQANHSTEKSTKGTCRKMTNDTENKL